MGEVQILLVPEDADKNEYCRAGHSGRTFPAARDISPGAKIQDLNLSKLI